MTTFDIQIVKCPHCGALMTHYELMSYTVHHVESWSDGKIDAGVPEMKQVGICAVCRQEFWIDDAKLHPDPDWQPENDLTSVLDMYDLEWIFDDERELKAIDYFDDLIQKDFADNDEREYYLRSHLLWAINDLVRYPFPWWRARNYGMLTRTLNNRRKALRSFKNLEDVYLENLERLVFLYIKSGNTDLLYLAELYREARNFEKASDILEKVELKNKLWKKFRKKVRQKDSRVFKLSNN